MIPDHLVFKIVTTNESLKKRETKSQSYRVFSGKKSLPNPACPQKMGVKKR